VSEIPQTPLSDGGSGTGDTTRQGPAQVKAVSTHVVVSAAAVCFALVVTVSLLLWNSISTDVTGTPPPRATPPSQPVSHAASAGSTLPSTTTTSIVPGTPSAPQPSAPSAAALLVSAWAAGNWAQALTIATPKAVTTLFDATYQSGLAIARGCSTAFQPIICTYGPPGGANPTDEIYQLSVVQGSRGWYVSNVKIYN